MAMIAVIALMLLAGTPKIIAGILDNRIGAIRKQLDEAKALRAEAEALRDEYARKAQEADEEVAALRASAERQAEEIVEKAKADASALIERHKVSAADKIATAERAAVDELRAKVASAPASRACRPAGTDWSPVRAPGPSARSAGPRRACARFRPSSPSARSCRD